MTAAQFLATCHYFSDKLVLVNHDGFVIGASPGVASLISLHATGPGKVRLHDIVSDPAADVDDQLGKWNRTTDFLPGAFRLPNGTRLRCDGAMILLETDGGEQRFVVIRLQRDSDASERFMLLNQKIEELTLEIKHRKGVEAENQLLLASEKDARSQAEQANRMKDEFLAVLSHELRTPLNAILGWAHLLRDERDPEVIATALNTIERNAKVQAEMVSDLLDVSRIMTGKLKIEMRPVDFASLVHAAVDSVTPAAEAKRITIRRGITPETGMLKGDADRLQQVAWNLLSNAVKFTPKDGEIDVRVFREGSEVRLTVSDNGVGIDAAILPFVFERFRQADSSSTRRHGGLGIGLAIVKHLVELHGGTVRAESRGAERGSTFTVNLPVSAVKTESFVLPEGADGDDKERNLLRGVRVLLVEDDPDSREVIALILRRAGADVVKAESVAQALPMIEDGGADVLVSDIEMPGENGYSLIRRIRALKTERARRLPAIALTAYAGERDRRTAIDAGFQVHLSKPVNPQELVSAIRSVRG